MKRLFLLFLATLANMGLVLASWNQCGDNLTWSFEYSSFPSGVLTISGTGDMYDYYHVRENTYEGRAPWRSYDIQSVIINSGVTSIGDEAFYSERSDGGYLTSVSIPNTVTRIGKAAFYSRDGLISINIPNSVTEIGEEAFSECSALRSATLPGNLTRINDGVFMGCSSLTSLSIPNGVTYIGEYAFWGCYSLLSLTLPNGIDSIGDYAFMECAALRSINIPDNLKAIGPNTFDGCSRLTSLDIPNSVTSIGDYAFYDCSSLASITLPDSATLGKGIFAGCSALTSVKMPENVTLIEEKTFQGCASLDSVVIPDNVTSIGYYAFDGCTGMKSLTIGSNVSSFGMYSFKNCTGLTTITCLRTSPPLIAGFVFDGVNKSRITVYVPASSVEAYKADYYWKAFKEILPIQEDTVSVTPSNSSVVIQWPQYEGTATYNLIVTNDLDTVCDVLFDSAGQVLQNSASSPRRIINAQAPAAIHETDVFSYTITGLESATQYSYSVIARDANNIELTSYSGVFNTTGEATAIDSTIGQQSPMRHKVLRDGQIYILRGGKEYTLTGQEVK